MADKKQREADRQDVALAARSAELGRKIAQKAAAERRALPAAEQRGGKQPSGSVALGFRLSADFLSAIVVGAALGWGADKFMGTAPWGMIILLLFGFATGIITILRSLGYPLYGGKKAEK